MNHHAAHEALVREVTYRTYVRVLKKALRDRIEKLRRSPANRYFQGAG